MTQMRKVLAVTEETTLLPFRLREVTGKSRNTVKGLLTRRQVMVDGTVVTRFDAPLLPGQQVTLLPPEAAGAAELPFPVLYQDRDLIAVDKPAGLLSMGNEKERTRTAYRMVSDYVKAREPGGRIFIVHRLDRDTSGVLVFAKNERMKRALQDHWEALVQKRGYVAAVEGDLPEPEGTVRSYLRETATHLVYSGPRGKEGREAVTHYRVLARGKGFSLVEVTIDTGRKNQIRVHMQDLGCLVAGDRQYGAQSDPMGRLALHAHVLRFTDPRSKKTLELKASLPLGFQKLFPGAEQ
ncbi:RluA family pseudouridine synthase [Intestinimonas butyriciproducens]|uniref:RluA family pseudouridine synthase n=1 Tax=Intestinimonas butyriciproducens TaxID=1297617 RepID=UPI001FADEF28|nr:RluA family pseudouridine synthase [Intestinimonas butyriciproducens]